MNEKELKSAHFQHLVWTRLDDKERNEMSDERPVTSTDNNSGSAAVSTSSPAAFDFNSLKTKLENESKTPLVRKIYFADIDRPLWVMKMASRHLAALYAARNGNADAVSDFADYLNTKVFLDETRTTPLATREQLMDLSPEAISKLFDKIISALPDGGDEKNE
jgi:hypothetical protein